MAPAARPAGPRQTGTVRAPMQTRARCAVRPPRASVGGPGAVGRLHGGSVGAQDAVHWEQDGSMPSTDGSMHGTDGSMHATDAVPHADGGVVRGPDLSIPLKAGPFFGQSQGDCVLQPKVASPRTTLGRGRTRPFEPGGEWADVVSATLAP